MTLLPQEFISEHITPLGSSFDSSSMARGEPGLPGVFIWRGKEYRVKTMIEAKKTLRSCRNGSGEQYINKHYYAFETESGEVMTVYRKRSGSKKDSWVLLTIERNKKVNTPVKTAVLVSGGGTNLQALIDYQKEHIECPYTIDLVVSSTKDAFALERAKKSYIKTEVCSPYSVMGSEKAQSADRNAKRQAVSNAVLKFCKQEQIEVIVLAGFLTVLSGALVHEYSGRIINLHPALLPKFGGVGMWGHHVHEAVLASGENESGCTVHLVDEGCDTGEILLQKKVAVLEGDTPETLYARIAPHEHDAMIEGLLLLSGRIRGV